MNVPGAPAGAGLLRPTILLMLGRSAGFAATFMIPVVLARVFDLEAFGTYKQLFLVFTVLYFTAQLGMAESLFYFVPGTQDRKGRYVANAVLVLGLSGIAALLGLVVARGEVAAGLNNAGLHGPLPLLAAFLALMLASAPLEPVLIARGRHLAAALTYGLTDLVRAALFIIPALLAPRLESVLLGGVLYAGGRLAVALACFRREFGADLRPDARLLRGQLVYALPFAAAVAVEVVQANLHQYVVSWQTTAAAFAIYAVGCLQVPFVDFVAGPAANVMMVRMSERLAAGDRGALVGLWLETTGRLAVIFFSLVGFLLVAARDLIIVLFTDAYAASVPVFMVWCASILFSALPTDGVLRVFARTRFLLVINVVRLLIVLASISWCLSRFGLPGAVLATLAGLAIAKVAMLAEMRRLLGIGLWDLLPWRTLVASLCLAATAAIPALVVRSAVPGPPAARLLLTGLAYGATCLLAWVWARRLRPGRAGSLRRAFAGMAVSSLRS